MCAAAALAGWQAGRLAVWLFGRAAATWMPLIKSSLALGGQILLSTESRITIYIQAFRMMTDVSHTGFVLPIRFHHAAAPSHIIVSANKSIPPESYCVSDHVPYCFHDYFYTGYVHIHPNQTPGISADLVVMGMRSIGITPCTRLQYFLKANDLNLIDAMNHEELSVTVHRVLRAYHTTFGGGMTIPTLGIKGVVKLEAGIR